MMRAFRFFLIAIALLLATAAYTHAASETGRAILSSGFSGHSGMDANVVGELVDGSFRAETMALQLEDVAERGGMAPEEISALAADPAKLERFIGARRHSLSRTPNMFPDISADLLRLARLSYSIDPLNVETLRTIALGHSLHEDQGRARQILRLASSLSKRDDITNMWLAQDYGRNGDAQRMLASFDHLLRTSRRARQGAIALVVSTLESDESHASFGKLLQQKPEWQSAFWAEFARNPVALANAGAFFQNSGVSLEQMPEDRRRTFYSNLKRTGQYDTLFELASLDPRTRTEGKDLESGAFAVTNQVNPLGWALNSQGTFAARVHGPNRELQIDARAGSFGIAAERIVRGGDDFQTFVRMGEAVPPGTRLRLTATCADGQNKELATVNLATGDQEGSGLISAQDCAFVRLAISFEVAQGRRNPLIRVAKLELERFPPGLNRDGVPSG